LDNNDVEKFALKFVNMWYGLRLDLIGADIIFDGSLIPPLLNLIIIFLDTFGHNEASCLLSCTIRNEETINLLRQEIEKLNIKFREVHTWTLEDDARGVIFQITS